MSRWSISLLTIAALGVAPAVSAHGTTCSLDSDGDGVEFTIDADLEFEGGDLVFERDGSEVARFTSDDELLIDGSKVTTDASAQREIAGYRGAYDDLIESAEEIGKEAASLAVSATMRAVAAIFTGDSDKVDAEIEAEAEAIEEHAEDLCDSVRDMRGHHLALSAAVPEFGAAVPLKD